MLPYHLANVVDLEKSLLPLTLCGRCLKGLNRAATGQKKPLPLVERACSGIFVKHSKAGREGGL